MEAVEEVSLEVVFVATAREAKRVLFVGFAMAKGCKAVRAPNSWREREGNNAWR